MTDRRTRLFILSLVLEGLFLFMIAYWLAKYDLATQAIEKMFYGLMLALMIGALVINSFVLIDLLRED